jgi:hypothetical protein
MSEKQAMEVEMSSTDNHNQVIHGVDFSVLEAAKALKKKIHAYKGGIKGVWEAIDPRFKYAESKSPHEIKYPKNNKFIKEGTFRKQVERLDKENSKYKKMTFGMNGNILLLMNVFSILGIKDVYDLFNTSFKKPDVKQFVIDTNINVKRTIRQLNKIYDTLQLSMKRIPRFTVTKVCHDWEMFLNDMKKIVMPSNEDTIKNKNLSAIINLNAIAENFLQRIANDYHRFGLSFCNLLSKYREYFFNDILLHKYYELITSIKTDEYAKNNNYFLISPLYALYFCLLMNKRFLLCLVSDNSRKNKEKFDFINDVNIKEDENIRELISGKSSGEYIFDRYKTILNKTKAILLLFLKNKITLKKDDYNDYLMLFKNIFFAICEMNLSYTDINHEWLDSIISKIGNMNDLFKIITLGRANRFQPTIDHLNTINQEIQKLEKIADVFERDEYEL